MSVSSTEHLERLNATLYMRPAGRNIIDFAIEEITRLRADLRLRNIELRAATMAADDERTNNTMTLAEVVTELKKVEADFHFLILDLGFDNLGDTDIHEEASISAAEYGREEASDDDYIAAFRVAIRRLREGK